MSDFSTASYPQRLEAAADILVPAIVSLVLKSYKGEIQVNQEQQAAQVVRFGKACHKARKIR